MYGFTIVTGVVWVAAWFGFMLLYTFLDVAIWRKIVPANAPYFNIVSIILCIIAFLYILYKQQLLDFTLFRKFSWNGILLSICCAILLYFLLDKCLDPIFEGLLPISEESYQETLLSLSKFPIASFIQVCILAPFIEEILMRGVILNGLSVNYGKLTALLISAFLFALLHFNMVQTISAFISGIILGILFLYTGSVLCSFIGHMGYNLISYIVMIYPLISSTNISGR